MSDTPVTPEAPSKGSGWFNRNVIGAGLTSFLADVGYETATATLPGFIAVLGVPALALGWIEGLADFLSSYVKLATGWWGDRLGRRKPVVVLGYALTGSAMSLFALATSWPLIFLGRTLAWFGKGIRGPLRNAILAESVPPQDRGKAFGFHRAGDTLGAVAGPLLGLWLLGFLPSGDGGGAYRTIFLLTLIPGLGAALAFGLLIQEKVRLGNPRARLWASVGALPPGYHRFLLGVGVFGLGDFAPTLLMYVTILLLTGTGGYETVEASKLVAALYTLRNVVHAVASFPVGALSDRWGRRGFLIFGYATGAAALGGFATLFVLEQPSLIGLAALYALTGIYMGVQEALESAVTADLVPDESLRGTAYGYLGAVNGLGDFFSSVGFGLLLDTHLSPAVGLAGAGVLMALGAILLARVR